MTIKRKIIWLSGFLMGILFFSGSKEKNAGYTSYVHLNAQAVINSKTHPCSNGCVYHAWLGCTLCSTCDVVPDAQPSDPVASKCIVPE